MVGQVFCVGCLIFGKLYPETIFVSVGNALLSVVVVLAIVSMIQYFRRFWSQIDETIKSREKLAHRRPVRILRKNRKHVGELINTGKAS